MMKCLIVALLLFFNFFLTYAQPPKVKTIIVKNIGYADALNALLDKGYTIESRDAEMHTASTTPIKYPRYWNGAYKIHVRVKDSTAYFTGTFQCPYDMAFASLLLKQSVNEAKWQPTFNRCDKKGRQQPKSMEGYPFVLMNDFVVSLGKEVNYE